MLALEKAIINLKVRPYSFIDSKSYDEKIVNKLKNIKEINVNDGNPYIQI